MTAPLELGIVRDATGFTVQSKSTSSATPSCPPTRFETESHRSEGRFDGRHAPRIAILTHSATVLAIAIVLATVPSVASAYRTAEDLPELMATQPVHWMSSSVSFGIEATSASAGGSFALTESAVQFSLLAWASPSCTGVKMAYSGAHATAAPGDGLNTIAFRSDGWTTHGLPANAMAFTDIHYTEIEPGRWIIDEADVYLNAYDFTWNASSGDPTSSVRSVRAVVTHELGHALGILHPCETDGAGGAPICTSDASFALATMYPTYRGPQQQDLGADDIAAVCALYTQAPCDPGCDVGESCVHGECVATCGSSICAVDETCVGGECTTGCSGVECLATGSCADAIDCASTEVCVVQLCLPRGGGVGDPCLPDGSCTFGECADGYCRAPCDGGQCIAEYSCSSAATPNVCEPSRASFAEACVRGAECVSGLCLLHSTPTSMCTRACGGSLDLPCPDSFECAVVQGISVCRPHLVPTAGCSLAADRSDSRLSPLALVCFAVLVLTFRRGALR